MSAFLASIMLAANLAAESPVCTKCEVLIGEGELSVGRDFLSAGLLVRNPNRLGVVESTFSGKITPDTQIFLDGRKVGIRELGVRSGTMNGRAVVCWPDVYEGSIDQWFLLLDLDTRRR